MELLAFDFTWLIDPIDTCLTGEGPVEGREAALRINGPTPVVYEVALGYCSNSGRWYGLLADLHAILDEQSWSYSDIESFRINETTVKTGVYMGPQQGTVPWPDFRDQASQTLMARDEPPPSLEEVRTLEQRPTTWEMAWRPVGWVGSSDEEAVLLHAALVHDSAGHIRAMTLHRSVPAAEQLEELMRRAAGTPTPPGTPIRPTRLRLADADAARDLTGIMDELNIHIEMGTAPQAEQALTDLIDHLGPDLPPPFFRDVPADEVRAYFETANRFFQSEPWIRFDGHKFLGFQFEDGPWYYANVMGQMEESPGLAVFDDWIQLCRFVHNQPSFFENLLAEIEGFSSILSAVEAAGAVEAITLDLLPALHPEDAAFLQNVDIPPIRDHFYPLPYRYDAEAGAVKPQRSPSEYRALMEAILIALERRRATPVTSIKTTLDVAGRTVSLRYPANGTERPFYGPETACLVIEGRDDEYDPTVLPAGLNLQVETPGDVLLEEVTKALQAFDEDFQHVGVGYDDVVLWNDRGQRKTPCPRVADLTDCEDLWIELTFMDFSVTFIPLSTAPPESVHVELVEA